MDGESPLQDPPFCQKKNWKSSWLRALQCHGYSGLSTIEVGSDGPKFWKTS